MPRGVSPFPAGGGYLPASLVLRISTPEVERPGMRTTTDEAPELEIVEVMSSEGEADPEEATFIPPSGEKTYLLESIHLRSCC